MTSKTDDPGKGPARPAAEGSTPKKPSAIIDLKATEVKQPGREKPGNDPKTQTTEDKGEVRPAQASPTPASGPQSAQSTEGARPTAATSSPKSAETEASAAKAGGGPADAKSPAGTPSGEQPSPRFGGGIAGFLTHLAAGIAGGFIALLAADAIGPRFGLTGEPSAKVTSELQRRLAAVEQTAKEPAAASADVVQKLAAAESRLARLEDLNKAVSQLEEAHAKLAGETKALEQKLSKPNAANELGARLAKLEETLATLAAAAANDPQTGRIPQLAAITGKLSDLEATLNNQLAALRKSLTQEIDARVAQVAEASETAKSGALRVDRDLAGVKEDAARLSQRVEALKATGDRFEQTLRVTREETAGLSSALEGLKGDVAAQLKTVARQQDVSAALSPIASKLTALEANLHSVVRSEQDRKANAERIVLALELGNLRRALDRGAAYSAELAEVKKVAGGKVDLAALERAQNEGVPTAAELTREFRSVAHAVIDAEAEPTDASVVDRLLKGAKSIVRVRRTDLGAEDKSAEAVVGRMEKALKEGKLADVLAEAQQLSPKARAAAEGWLDKLEARAAVDQAIAQIEDQLKASLAGNAPTEKRTQ